MRLTLNPSSAADYATFLRIKSLPKFRFIGRTAEVPDEYADLLGLGRAAADASDYIPWRGLFDYQRDISALAIRKRKFAIFARPGLGKTLMQTEFARHAAANLPADKCVLMIAPLMVVPQTLEEVAKFYGTDLPIRPLRAAELSGWLTSGKERIGITNYEALKDDTPQGRLGALVIDESSIMKSAYGKYGQIVVRLGRGLDWKLAATGTPAPNDRIEYATHSVFLDAFPTVNSFLARFFVNRGQTQNRWELKPHALRPFYRALSHWSIFLSDPSTYGWQDNAGGMPPVRVHIHDVPLTPQQRIMAGEKTGTLFGHAGGITSRGVLSQIAKGNLKGQEIQTNKPAFIRGLVEGWPDESTLIWCLYNREQEAMEQQFPNAHSMKGDTKAEDRVKMLADFRSGKVKVLISKSEILGFGLNLQIATRHVFSGLQDSYEAYYQCICRSNRIGSTKPLDVHIPITSLERPMVQTVLDKARRVEADTREQEALFKEVGHAA